MSKQPKVPGTKNVKPNRAQRRHPEKAADAPLAREAERPQSDDVPDDQAVVPDPGKKTAEKWNQ